MAERPLLFSAPMVRAVLAGTKTQTRRVVKAGEALDFLGGGADGERATASDVTVKWGDWKDDNGKTKPAQWLAWSAEYPEEGCIPIGAPYGNVGDRLWVRETHAFGPSDSRCLVPGESGGTVRWPLCTYKADGGTKRCDTPWRGEFHDWRPSIHMPRWASRITLEVTGVRVERLQDISENDATAEGVERVVVGDGWRRYCDTEYELAGVTPCETARGSYASLWDHINGPDSWDANPWVWVVEFKRMTT